MADTPIANPFDGLQGLFDKIIGSSTVGTDQQSLSTNQILQNLMNSLTTQNQTTTGNQVQTNNQQTTGTVQNTSDVSALQKVFQQQQAGVTPDMLKAIFTEGAKAVPQLVATTANAVGARPGSNSALATSLDSLNNNLVSQAAQLNQSMLNQSGQTAAQIADATKSQTTTNNTTGNQQLSTTQQLQNLLQQMQQQNQTTDTQQLKRDDSTSKTGINSQQTGIAAGLAGLASLLGSNPGDLLKAIPGLGSLFGGGTVGSPDLGSNPGDPNADSNPDLNGTPFDPTIPSPDMGNDIGIGYADGGVVDPAAPKMLQITDTKSGAPNVNQLLSLLGGSSSGTAGSSSSSGAGAGGVDLASLMGAGGSAGVGAAANPGQVGPNIAPLTMFNLVTAVATMNIPSLVKTLVNITQQATAPASGAGGSAGTGSGSGGNGPVGSVSVGPATATDADTGAPVGVDAGMSQGISVSGPVGDSTDGDASADGPAGDAGDGSGSAGDGGVGGTGDGGDGGGGWANGGVIPKMKIDPNGTMDPLHIRVSGGEAIIPSDVVDYMGPDFFNSMIALYHTPAALQTGIR
jgi:hypothetical protein